MFSRTGYRSIRFPSRVMSAIRISFLMTLKIGRERRFERFYSDAGNSISNQFLINNITPSMVLLHSLKIEVRIRISIFDLIFKVAFLKVGTIC